MLLLLLLQVMVMLLVLKKSRIRPMHAQRRKQHVGGEGRKRDTLMDETPDKLTPAIIADQCEGITSRSKQEVSK
jgi:hypothetical protein